MKFQVNDRCIGCGLCVNTCSDVFEMTDEGVATAKAEADEQNKDEAIEAMEGCPVEAIETV